MEWLWHVMDRLIAAVCALACMQVPSFFMQYMQRLAGHLQELTMQLDALAHLANVSGRTLPQYIQKFSSQIDRDFSEQGVWMQGLVQRHEDLGRSFEALQQATPWGRPFTFLTHVDRNIAFGTWEEFQPSVTFSTEALLYAFCGILIGSCLVFCVSRLFKLCIPRMQSRAKI